MTFGLPPGADTVKRANSAARLYAIGSSSNLVSSLSCQKHSGDKAAVAATPVEPTIVPRHAIRGSHSFLVDFDAAAIGIGDNVDWLGDVLMKLLPDGFKKLFAPAAACALTFSAILVI
jgi:hypothetical protein